MRVLELLAIVVVSLAIAVGVIIALSGGPLTGRDTPGVQGQSPQAGTTFRNLGDATLVPGQRRPRYDSDPPTSGAHRPATVRANESELTDDQLLSALALGDVVVMYGTRRPPDALRQLAGTVAAPFSPALAAAGQAVILARRPGTRGLLAVAWTRIISARSASEPQLRSFILLWLGRGAPPSHN